MSKYIRASQKTPCLVCGGKKWPCSYLPDRSVSFCSLVTSNHQSKDGMTWLHFAEEIRRAPVPQPRPVKPKIITRAGPDHLHEVYSALLNRLSLSPVRYDSLLSRGLTPSEIECGGHKDTPADSDLMMLAQELSSLNLAGVPGFYRHHGAWALTRCLPGFFVPYRDSQRRIRGMMYRLDVPIEKQKYRWLSSNPDKFTGGTTSGAPLHFARPDLLRRAREIWLTEGAMKSDIAASYLHKPFVAAGGVHQWGQHFAVRFRSQFPHIKRFVIAYDSDWRTNIHVRAALEKLMAQLEAALLSFVVRTWVGAKGIDDFCLTHYGRKEALAA